MVRPVSNVPELTVESKAKERRWIELPTPASKVAKVRVWGVEHEVPRQSE